MLMDGVDNDALWFLQQSGGHLWRGHCFTSAQGLVA